MGTKWEQHGKEKEKREWTCKLKDAHPKTCSHIECG
jgi:hypothetical protein